MQIVTSWMEEGIEQGLQQGMEQGLQQGMEQGLQRGVERETNLVLRQLRRYLGELPVFLESSVRALEVERLEALGESFFDFESVHDLVVWLMLAPPVKQQPEGAIALLESHLGELSTDSKVKIVAFKQEQLQQLGKVLLTFEQVQDLYIWLEEQV